MNILILNDDGADAYGLKVLREAAVAKWAKANIVTIAPKTGQSGAGCSVSPTKKPGARPLLKVTRGRGKSHAAAGTPLDIILHAFENPEAYCAPGSKWDLVLSGVNAGANAGMDVMVSGTVAPLIFAARVFDTTCWAFSQELPDKMPKKPSDIDLARAYRNSSRYLSQFFHQQEVGLDVGGTCTNVNFPKGPSSLGWLNTEVAAYSRYINPALTPQVFRNQPRDIEYLAKGHITMSPIDLALNPPASY